MTNSPVHHPQIVCDRSIALFLAARLNDMRRALKTELERYDIEEDTRRELHKEVDALNRIISRFGRGRISREERTSFGEPEFLVLAEWNDERLEVYETLESELGERLNDLEEDEAVTTVYRVIPEIGNLWTVFSANPEGDPETAEVRRQFVERRTVELEAQKATREADESSEPE